MLVQLLSNSSEVTSPGCISLGSQYGVLGLPKRQDPLLGLADGVRRRAEQYIRHQSGCRSCRRVPRCDYQPPLGPLLICVRFTPYPFLHQKKVSHKAVGVPCPKKPKGLLSFMAPTSPPDVEWILVVTCAHFVDVSWDLTNPTRDLSTLPGCSLMSYPGLNLSLVSQELSLSRPTLIY